jgi:uncharacterized protein YjbJ (UPF0337 family)
MEANTKNKMAGIYREVKDKDKKNAGEKSNVKNLEAEGACETIVGKDEDMACQVKT